MRKRLVLITRDPTTKNKYLEDLRNFFQDYIDIEGYSIKEEISGIIEADLAIITSPVLTNLAKIYLAENMQIIYMDRTLSRKNLEKLYHIPAGTKAMLVANDNQSSLENISLLYELGIKYIDFIPVYPGMVDIPNLKIAVTPAQIHCIPKGVETVIDIGWRTIDLSTLMSIAIKLDILKKELEEKMEIYARDIIPRSSAFQFTFSHTHSMKNQLDIILDVIDDGIIIMNNLYKMVHYNKAISRIFFDSNRKENVVVNDVQILPETLYKRIQQEDYLENKIIKLPANNKILVVTKKSIKTHDGSSGYIVIIKDITQIQNLENELRKELRKKGYIAKYKFKDISGSSQVLKKSVEKAKKIARIDAPVLIIGESGTGKELFAQSIHNGSSRSNKPFVAINCAALPSQLLESELFGYEEGAFTGAKKGGKKGLFQLAHTGTLFLDEIGDIPMEVQVKLLRVLQEKEVMQIGGMNVIPIDVRVIAATNRDLLKLMEQGKFRMDLYYRLNVLSLHLPPLRERKEDIQYLINDILSELGCGDKRIDQELMDVLLNYRWNGNVRELRNCVEYMAYFGEKILNKNDLPEDIKNIISKNGIQQRSSVFPELSSRDQELAKYILSFLKSRNAGRRQIYYEAISQGYETSEYEVRKIMEHFYKKQWLYYGKGRGGAKLTNAGNEMEQKIFGRTNG